MNQVPSGERLYIGIFGPRNAGKSSLLNALTGQETAIVSEVKGTTTDPIYKNMEITGLGPITLIDTAGFDDEGDLGDLRTMKTRRAIERCDGFIYLLSPGDDGSFLEGLRAKDKPIIYVAPKADLGGQEDLLEAYRDLDPLPFSSHDPGSKDALVERIRSSFKKDRDLPLHGGLVSSGDLVLLVMPQDPQAPKGRLILPQVQMIRAIIDEGAMALCAQPPELDQALARLGGLPDLVITDSQCFKEVHEALPEEVPLTSFSLLFSAYKGDLAYFVKSARTLEEKVPQKIAIAEACTHPPAEEDIGTVKIPKMLRKKYGQDLDFTFLRGQDFEGLEDCDLIVHCGSCMFNRTQVLNRVARAREMGIPMTNYGILIAQVQGILDKVALPEEV